MMNQKPAAGSSPVHTNGTTFAEIEPKMRPDELYELEWIELYTDLVNHDLRELRRIGLQRGFKARKFRSIYWALLLGVLDHDDPYHWLNERRTARNEYAVMREQFNKNPYQRQQSRDDDAAAAAAEENKNKPAVPVEKSIVNDDPLSQNEESVWNSFFCDQELTKLINQDVCRTFPGVDFFRRPETQTQMANILFSYARSHPAICYRQGMHELLAPLLFVVHSDHLHLQEIKKMTKCINPTMFEMLDPSYLEADTFGLFTKLMDRMETYYRIRNVVPTASGELPRRRTTMNDSTNGDSVSSSSSNVSSSSASAQSPPPQTAAAASPPAVDELEQHIKWMRVNVLARHDRELDEHLKRLNIPISVIGIRWYRLLFGREVSFADLMTLWDAIFADNFRLAKFLPAAMLISVRQKVLTSDFVGAYECLMSLQETIDIRKLIKYSMYLQDGQRYKRPEGVFVPVHPQSIRKDDQGHNVIPRSGTLPARQMPRKTSQAAAMQEMQRQRSNSMRRVPVRRASEMVNKTHHELGISDGYMENDPAVLKMNIEYTEKVMAISRLKLIQYVKGLRDNLPPAQQKAVGHYLDGLEELCAFMEPRAAAAAKQGNGQQRNGNTRYESPPVERAYAADELENGKIQATPRSSSGSPAVAAEFTSTPKSSAGGGSGQRMLGKGSRSLSQQEAKTEFVKTLMKDCDTQKTASYLVEEENATESQTMIMTASMLNDLSHQSGSSSSGTGAMNGYASSYEYPEHRIPRMAQKVIGDRREVELLEIVKNDEEGEEDQREWSLGSDFVPSANPQGERRDSN